MERVALIMAGGSGQRFWPLSRRNNPKQFLKLFATNSLVALSFNRISSFISRDNIFIVCVSEYRDKIIKEIPEFKEDNLIIEPLPRDTASAIGLGVIYIKNRFPNANILVCASDHLIEDEDSFSSNINMGFDLSEEKDCIITIGIKPIRPETNYGYIELGDSVASAEKNSSVYKVKSFREKPDYNTALTFLKETKFLWNSGMFIFKADTMLKELHNLVPDLYSGLSKIEQAIGKDDEDTVKYKLFSSLRKISIDFAVMERTGNILCISSDFTWDDVGSWNSYFRLFDKDKDGNIAKGKTIAHKTKDSLIIGGNKDFIGVIGLSNVIVIKTKDAFLVCDRNSEADIKGLIEKMQDNFENYL